MQNKQKSSAAADSRPVLPAAPTSALTGAAGSAAAAAEASSWQRGAQFAQTVLTPGPAHVQNAKGGRRAEGQGGPASPLSGRSAQGKSAFSCAEYEHHPGGEKLHPALQLALFTDGLTWHLKCRGSEKSGARRE